METILQEADRLVSGDRHDSYKHPFHDYECTAAMWSAMIKKKHGIDIHLSPDFCTLMMAAMKISREVGKHKRDNLVDLAGYARCTEMILETVETEDDRPSEQQRLDNPRIDGGVFPYSGIVISENVTKK